MNPAAKAAIAAAVAIAMIATIAAASVYIWKIETKPDDRNIANSSYGSSKELEAERARLSRIEGEMPFLVSSDAYKSMSASDARAAASADFEKLLAAALECYKANEARLATPADALSSEAYMPILAFAKYSVEYERYLRDLAAPSDARKREPKAFAYLDAVAALYREDSREFDRVAFDVLAAPSVPKLPEGSLAAVAQERIASKVSKPCELYERLAFADPYASIAKDVRSAVVARDLESAFANSKASYDGDKKDVLAFWVLCKLLVDYRAYVDEIPQDVFDYSWDSIKPLLTADFLAYVDGLVAKYRAGALPSGVAQ